MAYNLHDYAQVEKSPLRAGIIDVFRRESVLMNELSFENSDTLSIQLTRTKGLPTVGWRKIGGTFSESKATFEPVQERVFDCGGFIDVDKLLVEAASIVNQRAIQTDAFITALAYQFQDYFINGDPTVEPDGFTGLKYRIMTWETGQHVNATSGLDISPDATGLAANQLRFITYVNQLIHKCDGHSCDMLLMNSSAYLALQAALTGSGLLSTTEDNYARKIPTWGVGGPKIIDVGVKADQSTDIITDLEDEDGVGSGPATSIYAVKMGDKFVKGFQLYGIDAKDIGLLESGVAYRTVVDWPLGIYHVNPRSFARLSGIIAA